jgi:hypothetical protein
MTLTAKPVAPPVIKWLPVEEVPPGEHDAIEAMIKTLQEQLRKRYSGQTVLQALWPREDIVHRRS